MNDAQPVGLYSIEVDGENVQMNLTLNGFLLLGGPNGKFSEPTQLSDQELERDRFIVLARGNELRAKAKFEDRKDHRGETIKISVFKSPYVIRRTSSEKPIAQMSLTMAEAKGYELTKEIKFDLPAVTSGDWEWTTYPKVIDSQETRKTLLAGYQEIWSAIEKKECAHVKKLFSDTSDIAKSLKLAGSTYEAPNVLCDFIKTGQVNGESGKIGAFDPKNFEFEIFANGKLARYVRADGHAALWFEHEDSATYFDVWFRQDAKRQWHVVR